VLILHCKITEIERGSEMTLTINELRDMVSMTILSYLDQVEGRRLSVEECCALVKWVDAHDFEPSLEVIREG